MYAHAVEIDGIIFLFAAAETGHVLTLILDNASGMRVDQAISIHVIEGGMISGHDRR